MTALEPYAKTHPDRVEHTELGLGIGMLRDSVFGAPTDADDRRSQAQTNDEVAHLAADVIATLPHIKWFGAGTLRMALLTDPNATDGYQALANAGLNFAGGVAMNVIGRSSQFGTLQTKNARWFGLNETGEAANHLQTGFALGLTRGLTDSRQWTDDEGHLKVANFGKIAGLGVMSGIANVPAGFAGTTIAGLSSAEGSALSRIMTGGASGFVSGGMFGATDGFLRQGSLHDALDGFAMGALTGAAAGGITAGAERGRQDLFYKVANKWRQPPVPGNIDGPLLGVEPLSANAQRALETHGANLEFLPKTRSLAQLTEQLGRGTPDEYRLTQMNPFGPKNYWSDAQYRSNIFSQLRPALMYKVNGVEIRVPTDYAAKLEEVRVLRLAAEEGKPFAAGDLRKHPLGSRLLPEDVIPLIERLPNKSVLREVELLDKPGAWDRWYDEFDNWGRLNKQRGVSFTTAADANQWAERIRFFKGRTEGGTRELRQIWDHEQVHLNHDPQYRTAMKVDEQIEANRYGYLNHKESEAELESITFWGSSEKFMEAVDRAPVRMSLIAKKLQDTIAKSPNGGGSEAEVLLKRIAYVNEHVMPIAQEKVLEAVRANKSSHERKGMADLLQRFNGSMSDSQREALIRWDSP